MLPLLSRIVMVACAARAALRIHSALPPARRAVAPSAVTFIPTKQAAVDAVDGARARQERVQRVVGFQLLLDRRELHELLRELVGVERIERALVLQLRRQEKQEGIEVLRDRGAVRTLLMVAAAVVPAARL